MSLPININVNTAYYVDICPHLNMGLSNQLYLLINGIVRSIQEKKKILLVGDFLLQSSNVSSKGSHPNLKFLMNPQSYHADSKQRIGQILALDMMNRYFSEKHDLLIIDYMEYVGKYMNVPKIQAEVTSCGNVVHSILGKQVLRNIKFNINLVRQPFALMKRLISNSSTKINIIHLRVEEDALVHWGKVNKIPKQLFLHKMVRKYVELIDKHITKTDITFVLCGDSKNAVIKYMKKTGHNCHILDKTSKHREINAIMDMVIGRMCNNVFIGASGSTFTQLISNYHENIPVKQSLNLNNIDSC